MVELSDQSSSNTEDAFFVSFLPSLVVPMELEKLYVYAVGGSFAFGW
jgi:hypothetical protein